MTLAHADRTLLPVGLKRCSKCQIPRPRTEEFFYRVRQSPTHAFSLGSGCLTCAPWYSRLTRSRRLARDVEAERAKERGYRERRGADPERHAAWLDYNREWLRTRHSYVRRLTVTRGRFFVDATPIQEAITASPLSMTEISHRAGMTERQVRATFEYPQITSAKARTILDVLGLVPAEVAL